jgi:hypothetical protein
VWDVTNETLNPFTQWFIQRLGPGIVNDMFAWVRAIDPGCQLVFNEWIREVFTGIGGPTAADVRDRVGRLRAAGVPIDAIGQQGHFVPGIVYAGGTADLSQRTRIDDYEAALDTLAQAGVPVHITETNFIAPDEPEKRAAQAEALMRVWWGNPAVEQVVFWALWNEVAARPAARVRPVGRRRRPHAARRGRRVAPERPLADARDGRRRRARHRRAARDARRLRRVVGRGRRAGPRDVPRGPGARARRRRRRHFALNTGRRSRAPSGRSPRSSRSSSGAAP